MRKQYRCRLRTVASGVAIHAVCCMLAAAVLAAPAGAAAPVGSVQFRTVDVPTSVSPPWNPPASTQVTGVNDAGTLVGLWTGAAGHQNGFIQQPGGQTISFDAFGLDTVAQAISDQGTVVGQVCTCGPGPSCSMVSSGRRMAASRSSTTRRVRVRRTPPGSTTAG